MNNRSRSKISESVIQAMEYVVNQLESKRLEAFTMKEGDKISSFERQSGIV